MAMFSKDQLYNDVGNIRTKALFKEFGASEFNILSFDDPDSGYPSLKSLYVNLTVNDPSEAIFAETIFGDITFWEKLKNAPWLKDRVADWQHEADVKRKSMAFEYIVKEIKEDGRNGYHAAKYLIDEPWKPKTRASTAAKRKSTLEAVPSDVADLAEFIKSRQ